MELKKIDALPPLVRGGGKRKSEEVKEIIEALKTGEPYKIPDVEAGDVHNALQQRIRSAAKSVHLKVTLRYVADTQELSFQGLGPIEGETEVEVETPVKPKGKSTTKTTV